MMLAGSTWAPVTSVNDRLVVTKTSTSRADTPARYVYWKLLAVGTVCVPTPAPTADAKPPLTLLVVQACPESELPHPEATVLVKVSRPVKMPVLIGVSLFRVP